MPRLPRIDAPGVAQHVMKYHVEIHAWVFMSNHIHLLMTAKEELGLSRLMQALGRKYVQYYNYKYKRTGTLWEGRFRSCLVQSDQYVLACYRYIELNPVRAKMVEDPKEYRWFSYSVNAIGKPSSFCVPHPSYLALGGLRRIDASSTALYF